jgi:hypothetical protein
MLYRILHPPPGLALANRCSRRRIATLIGVESERPLQMTFLYRTPHGLT